MDWVWQKGGEIKPCLIRSTLNMPDKHNWERGVGGGVGEWGGERGSGRHE